MKHILTILIVIISLSWTSCFKEIDTIPIPRTIDESFTVEYSIKSFQSYYRFYENAVLEVDTARPTNWDMAFESAGTGSRVVIGWASASTTVKTGYYNMNEVSQSIILDLITNSDDWTFDDPTYLNTIDSLSLKDWENGEVYVQSRGTESDNYYIIQFVARDANSYTFRYASAQSLTDVKEATIVRNTDYNFMYFSYKSDNTIVIEPQKTEWDLMFTPYLGWWASVIDDSYSPYIQSGCLINNENGVMIARLFDPEVLFEDIDFSYVAGAEFIDMKGAIGSNWKLLGAVGAENLYTMDPDKKYIMKKYDEESGLYMYFKLQIVDYKLNGLDHYPTMAFSFLGSE